VGRRDEEAALDAAHPQPGRLGQVAVVAPRERDGVVRADDVRYLRVPPPPVEPRLGEVVDSLDQLAALSTHGR